MPHRTEDHHLHIRSLQEWSSTSGKCKESHTHVPVKKKEGFLKAARGNDTWLTREQAADVSAGTWGATAQWVHSNIFKVLREKNTVNQEAYNPAKLFSKNEGKIDTFG